MDYYSILGLEKNASPEEIKKAYRKLASQHHPDKGGDTSKFQQIQEAYSILGDVEKRREYDNPIKHDFGFNQNTHDINEIFSQIFGQRHHQWHNQKQLLRTSLNLSLLDAYKGSSQIVKLQSNYGVKVLDIKIPPGVRTGDQIKYDNIVENSILIVQFNVMPDLKFDRKGNDLYCNHSVSVLDLIVGNSFIFETISNKKIEVKIPPLTQPYIQLKLNGHGMPIPNTNRFGDQLILLKPFIPDNIHDDIVQSILRNRPK
jgi:curved DNA-binding protein